MPMLYGRPRFEERNVDHLLASTPRIGISGNPFDECEMAPRNDRNCQPALERILALLVGVLEREAVHRRQDGEPVPIARKARLLLHVGKNVGREARCVAESPFNGANDPTSVVGRRARKKIDVTGRARGSIPAHRVSPDEEITNVAARERLEDLELIVRNRQDARCSFLRRIRHPYNVPALSCECQREGRAAADPTTLVNSNGLLGSAATTPWRQKVKSPSASSAAGGDHQLQRPLGSGLRRGQVSDADSLATAFAGAIGRTGHGDSTSSRLRSGNTNFPADDVSSTSSIVAAPVSASSVTSKRLKSRTRRPGGSPDITAEVASRSFARTCGDASSRRNWSSNLSPQSAERSR